MSTQPRRGPLNSFRRYIEREPIRGRPELEKPVDDGAHVALLRKLGGFDIRNQWLSQQGRALP